MDENEQLELIKIVIVGDSGVGKTNIIYRYTKEIVPSKIEPNSIDEVITKKLTIKDKQITLHIWDLPGKAGFQSPFLPMLCKSSDGGFIVYDISQRESFENVNKWFEALNNSLPKNSTIILLGNKSDLNSERKVELNEGQKKAEDLKISFYETCASNLKDINDVFNELLNQIIEKMDKSEKEEKEEKEKKEENFEDETKKEDDWEKIEKNEEKSIKNDIKAQNKKCKCPCF